MTIAERQKAKNDRADRNLRVLRSPEFLEACKRADISPTHRQASKFARGFGRAFTTPRDH